MESRQQQSKKNIFSSRCCSVYFNRSCPRACVACSVVKPSMDRGRLKVPQWIEAFEILRSRGIEFFLILATEPLLVPEVELLPIIRYWAKENIEYGLYTTSVQPMFDRLKDKLLDAGIRNWSSGMDYVPEVYDRMKAAGKLSETCISLVESPGGSELRKKGIESLAGMRYMFDHGIEEQQLTITIYRSNLEFVPEMVSWIVENFGHSVRIALNYVEYGGEDGFDFASDRAKADLFLIKESDKLVWLEFADKMKSLEEKYWLRVQTPESYLLDFETAIKQDAPGSPLYCSVSIESSGRMRKCGYRTGTHEITDWSVFDLKDDSKFLQFIKEWEFQVSRCVGCSWAYKPTVNQDLYFSMLDCHRKGKDHSQLRLVNYRGENWQNRRRKSEGLV